MNRLASYFDVHPITFLVILAVALVVAQALGPRLAVSLCPIPEVERAATAR